MGVGNPTPGLIMARVFIFVLMFLCLSAAIAFIWKAAPKLWASWRERGKRKTIKDIKAHAFDRSHDLLTMIMYDPAVSRLVFAGLRKHLAHQRFEELSEEDIEQFAEAESLALEESLKEEMVRPKIAAL